MTLYMIRCLIHMKIASNYCNLIQTVYMCVCVFFLLLCFKKMKEKNNNSEEMREFALKN